MMLELVDQLLCAMHARLKKWNEKLRIAEKQWDVAGNTDILRMSVHKILRQNLGMKKVCSRLVLKVLMPEQKKERVFIHYRNIFERLRGGSNASWIDHHEWWVVGFRKWFVHKASVNAVNGEQRTMARKSSHGSVPVKIDGNFIFRRLKARLHLGWSTKSTS